MLKPLSVFPIVLFLFSCNPLSSTSSNNSPTPLPTYTYYPTYTIYPTIFSEESSSDLAKNTKFAEIINEYRKQNGEEALNISYTLSYIAASRVQLTMIPGINLGSAQIDPKTMPQNYTWTEYTFAEDDALALSINTPEMALNDLVVRRDLSKELQESKHHDIGASILCNGQRCGYIVILGSPH